jgi:peptide/nickel transport system substrate-binding protein
MKKETKMKKWICRSVLTVVMCLGLMATNSFAADAPAGTFRFAEEVKLITLDPHKHTGGGIPYMTPVYESLFRKTPENQVEPLLATGFKYSGSKVEITLREGVAFSDGESFNAKAAAANINRGVKLGVLRSLSPVEGAAATGEFTVEITLKKPAPSIIEDLAGRAGMMISPKAMTDPALDRNPVGTGPYVYNAKLSREGEVRVYTLNSNYWEPSAQGLERIEIWEMPDNTARLNALSTGQIDIGKWLANPQALIIEKTPGLTLLRRTGGRTYSVIIMDRAGTKVPAFADKRVRQAMSYAIDRQAFADVVQFGLATPSIQPVGKGHWAYNPELAGKFEYSPAKARKLLAEAGYKDGFTFTMPSIPVFASRCEALAGFFADVGITMKIEPLEPGTLARRSRSTDFPATNLLWSVFIDLSLLPPLYLNEKAAFNPYRVKPGKRLAELAQQGAASADIAVRAPIYQEMFEILADEAFLIYITSGQYLTGATEKIAKNPTIEFAAGATSPYWRGLRLSR